MLRTKNTISKRYSTSAFAASRAAGGWDGPATRLGQEGILTKCYVAGMTSAQAGLVLALEYSLHSALSDAIERVGS